MELGARNVIQRQITGFDTEETLVVVIDRWLGVVHYYDGYVKGETLLA